MKTPNDRRTVDAVRLGRVTQSRLDFGETPYTWLRAATNPSSSFVVTFYATGDAKPRALDAGIFRAP